MNNRVPNPQNGQPLQGTWTSQERDDWIELQIQQLQLELLRGTHPSTSSATSWVDMNNNNGQLQGGYAAGTSPNEPELDQSHVPFSNALLVLKRLPVRMYLRQWHQARLRLVYGVMAFLRNLLCLPGSAIPSLSIAISKTVISSLLTAAISLITG
ncbi:hypothetical protein SCHPADRAFT_998228 [Schizopora paradoxa]|uniref:Uncharacterized protein n=1 Tax=Schizopora paradoxa TaxID=27342 RepID=A0A0H2S5Y5_9AGAM|nr:hypothetical protein SCHPADRAFT_998228 [Schizopora paradoxa]